MHVHLHGCEVQRASALSHHHVQALGLFALEKIKNFAQGQRAHEQAVVYEQTMRAIE